MKKLFILAALCSCLGCFASDGTVTVNRQTGTYTVGAKRNNSSVNKSTDLIQKNTNVKAFEMPKLTIKF